MTAKIAKQLVAQYATVNGDDVHVLGGYPGILYPPYYWWEAGAMFGTLLDYWHYTGDDQYNDMVREGLIHNFGEKYDLVRGLRQPRKQPWQLCFTHRYVTRRLTFVDAGKSIEERGQ